MCGIAGYWANSNPDIAIAERMALQIAHRGPDDSGVSCDAAAGLALVHRRLSVVDLSPAGHQPMHSSCGRYVLVYNGEIYNHAELRADLEREGGSFTWRGHSDSETLLAALRHWGVPGALERLNGMFAFALWDSVKRLLFLARDRMGEKPLYYGRCNGTFLFGSELKALRAHPDWHAQIDRDALCLYLRHNCVPAPWSIYQGIQKLPPAHFVVISDWGRNISEPTCYWDVRALAAGRPSDATAEELINELEALMLDAVGRRMAADVPLGAFLSGGYDSSLIAALMQAQSERPIKTFSIGFHEAGYDEAKYARLVSEHLGTEHTELYVTAKDATSVIPELPTIFDEPFSDSSQIPTLLVSRLARRDVTVCLSGDGGDELFCGYNRYLLALNVWKTLQWLPLPVRQVMAAAVGRAPGRVLDWMQRLLPQRFQVSSLVDRLPKLAGIMSQADGLAMYRCLVSHNQDPASLVRGALEPETVLSRPDNLPPQSDLREQMMLLDMLTYLPDDILTKVDRASMAVNLEVRVPLLDHRVVEFALRVPTDLKYRDGQSKWLLRQVLFRHIPRHLLDRPKMGFGVPIEYWLRDSLRDWAEALLDEKRLREQGIFNPEAIIEMWRQNLSGKRRNHYQLWDVLMFQAWYEEQNKF